MSKILMTAFVVLLSTSGASAKTSKELNAKKNRTPASERYRSDEYVTSVVESTKGFQALKNVYGPCALVGVKKSAPNEHLVPKKVTYACSNKDGKVSIEASTEVAGWGETTDITLTVTGISGVSNE